MTTVGIFAMNMSPKSGGVFSLIDGLMTHAHLSRHRFIYLSPRRDRRDKLPDNVELIERPDLLRKATQGALNVPGASTILRSRTIARTKLSAVASIPPSVYARVDHWLWPHAFMPIPNLGPVSVICHDLIHRHHPEYFSRMQLHRRAAAERMLPMCRSILCPSQATADDLLREYPALAPQVRLFSEAPSEIMPPEKCAAEIEQIRTRFGDTPLFLFVGVDWPHKNHELLIHAAARLRAITDKPFQIIFIGHRRDGRLLTPLPPREGQGEGGDLCDPERFEGRAVIDLGPQPRAVLAACYHRAAALVFPSQCEGFGIPLVEAMHYGLPILASNVSCMPEICGGCAELLPPDDPAAWARRMLELMTNPADRAALAAAAKQRGAAFSWQQTWRELDDALAL